MDPRVDLSDVQRLLDIVQRHGLEGLTVTDGALEISISAEPPARGEPVTPPAAETPEDRSRYYQLKSPITGVFYRSSSPTEPAFATEGETVEEHEVVCLIEAMKIFNEITAGLNGRVVRVLAANEQLVVTGEVLMELEPLDGIEA